MPVSPVTMPPIVAMTPVMAVSPMPAMPHLDDFSTGGTGGHRSLLDHSGHSLAFAGKAKSVVEPSARTARVVLIRMNVLLSVPVQPLVTTMVPERRA